MLPPFFSEAMIRWTRCPKPCFGLQKRKHGLRTPNRGKPRSVLFELPANCCPLIAFSHFSPALRNAASWRSRTAGSLMGSRCL
jgi:hypothetical protein